MISKANLNKLSDVLWEIPQNYRSDMKVPARIFATEAMLDSIFNDRTLSQLVNVATLEGIVGHALAMPDTHEGYGFPIGGVAAVSYPHGVISPGGIGYDINCGVRLLRSQMSFYQVAPRLAHLAQTIYSYVPSGVGQGGQLRVTPLEMDEILKQGSQWMLKHGYATPHDLAHTESNGCLDNADPTKVSDDAKKRGFDQLGTIGAGNHFAEVDVVEQIYDEKAAQLMGLWKNQMVVLIHCGSRGLGPQVATDYIRIMMRAMAGYGIQIPDQELACVPFSSPEGSDYFAAMAAAANFAWANRQLITHEIRGAWEKIYGPQDPLQLIYDVAHNIAKIETHEIDGKKRKVIVHRKGATRAFGPDFAELPQAFQEIGQPVLIPGSMGTASYVLVGTKEGMQVSFGSCCHGAGRIMSRAKAKQILHGQDLKAALNKQGIFIETGSLHELAEEAPQAYKDVDEVVDVVCKAGIAKKVARLKPCVVVKG